MSDIALNWGVFEYAFIALIVCGPGAVLGLAIGAIGWREHRVRGGVLGAITGFALLLGYFIVYLGSNLSLSDGPAEAALKSLVVAWPGVIIGGAAAAFAWRGHRVLGAIAGAPAGFVAWLFGWWLLT